jgi:hypothetical protein
MFAILGAAPPLSDIDCVFGGRLICRMQAKANGKTDDEVKLLIDAACASKRKETI